jgi:hypothetical protein
MLQPASDPGRFNLQIDGSSPNAASENVGDGGTTGEVAVSTGDHTVRETAGTSTDLADYQKSIVCKAEDGAGSIVAQTRGDDEGPLTVNIPAGSDIVCTITNTRKTGTIEVIKKLEPASDPGRFHLQIDGSTKKTDAQNGGTTSPVTVNTGTNHSVSEAAGTNTSLSDYTSRSPARATATPAESGSGTSLSNIAVAKDDRVICAITNTRNTGTIEVIKKLVPASDPGKFNLQVDGQTKKNDATNNGTSGPVTVATGSGHSVSEEAGTSTNLADYTSSISCTRNGNAAGYVKGKSLSNITVAKDDRVVCTITNTRKTGTIEVLKKASRRAIPASSTSGSTAPPRRPMPKTTVRRAR